MANYAQLYARFRGSKAFLVGLCGFVAIWLGFHFVFGIDKDMGELNFMLSLEASVSLAFFSMLSDAQDSAQREIVNDIRRIGEATLNMAEAQRDMLADHTALLKAMRDHDKQVLEALTSVLEK